jgi:hypothetical protein
MNNMTRSHSVHVRMKIMYKDLDKAFESRTAWETCVQTDFKEIIWEGLDWVCLAQDT